MNKERIIRKVIGDKQSKINIPSEFGFYSNEYVELIKLSDNSFKVIKVDVTPKNEFS